MINSPANPTGAVLSAERIAAIAELSRGNGPFIVSDEIYHGLSYGGRDRTVLEFTDRAFVLNGFSKAYAMTGWRLGWVVGPREHIRALQTLYGNFFISTNEFVQWAGVAALREAGDDSRRFRAIFDDRRRAMIAGLRSIGLGVGAEPTGAFYVLANARHCLRGFGEPRSRDSRIEPRRGDPGRGVRRPTPRAICGSPTPRRSSGSRRA